MDLVKSRCEVLEQIHKLSQFVDSESDDDCSSFLSDHELVIPSCGPVGGHTSEPSLVIPSCTPNPDVCPWAKYGVLASKGIASRGVRPPSKRPSVTLSAEFQIVRDPDFARGVYLSDGEMAMIEFMQLKNKVRQSLAAASSKDHIPHDGDASF